MKVRNKILVYFSGTVILLLAASLIIAYVLFSAHREEAFQQQQFSKIKYTIDLIEDFQQKSAEVAQLLDMQDIHDFYDEKLLVYDKDKRLIFASIDSLDILHAKSLLNELSVNKQWIETREADYDIIGVYVESNGKNFYAISKAYDAFGYSKKEFLRKAFIGIFFASAVIIILVSLYLSNIISRPIADMSAKISEYDLSNAENQPLSVRTNTLELKNLTDRFNEVLQRSNEVFLLQKHTIQHISHELKTPIAILVSELERLEKEQSATVAQQELGGLTEKAKSLGNIINALLQISKIESGQPVNKSLLRADELIFDVMEELNMLYPDFYFEIQYIPDSINEQQLQVMANEMLLRQAMMNLLINSIHYSADARAMVKIDCSQNGVLEITVINNGETLSVTDQRYLFRHFFRGDNSQHKPGFGLGLVLAKRIFSLHEAALTYQAVDGERNLFTVTFSKTALS